MNVETEIDVLKLSHNGRDYHLTDVKIIAEVIESEGDCMSHPDDPSQVYEATLEINIETVEWWEDEETETLGQELILKLVKESNAVEEALYCDYDK